MEALNNKPTRDYRDPCAVDLVAGQKYSWCTCNRSENPPFCDGAHRGKTLLKSLKFNPKETKTYYLCGCKETKNPPYCDGAHTKLDW